MTASAKPPCVLVPPLPWPDPTPPPPARTVVTPSQSVTIPLDLYNALLALHTAVVRQLRFEGGPPHHICCNYAIDSLPRCNCGRCDVLRALETLTAMEKNL